MIKILKLVTGEELLGDVEVTESYFYIKDPVVLTMVPSRSNPEQPSMAMIPYAAYVKDNKVKITKEFVVWNEEPIKELYNQYNSVFGNGLVMAPASSLRNV